MFNVAVNTIVVVKLFIEKVQAFKSKTLYLAAIHSMILKSFRVVIEEECEIIGVMIVSGAL